MLVMCSARRSSTTGRTLPEQEIEAQRSGIRDSVLPIVEAGLATYLEPDGAIVAGVSFFPTPGHTPGHCSVSIESNDERGVVTGDVIHHPCQIARPAWSTVSDYDPDLARQSRERLLASVVGTDTRRDWVALRSSDGWSSSASRGRF